MKTILLIATVGQVLAELVAAEGSRTAVAPSIVVRNNHELPYTGPVVFNTDLPNGIYGAVSVEKGVARVDVALKGKSEYDSRNSPAPTAAAGLYRAKPCPGGYLLEANHRSDLNGKVEFGLVTQAAPVSDLKQVASAFQACDFSEKGESQGFQVEYAMPVSSQDCFDTSVKITKLTDAAPPSYIALVMKVTCPGMTNLIRRWDGAIQTSPALQTEVLKQNKQAQGLDWCAWGNGQHSFSVINAFAPGYTAEVEPAKWMTVGSFFVRRQVCQLNDALFFIADISPPVIKGEEVAAVKLPPFKGETIQLRQRLAVAAASEPPEAWAESHFRVFSGFNQVTHTKDGLVVDLGVRAVEFGTSYFPYSTLTENFDYYRTPGLLDEGWWSISPKMWENWRAFIPKMKTDMRIIKAQGFTWLRPHHIELLNQIKKSEADAFLDFYMGECRSLGLKVMLDSSGSPESIAGLVARYKEVIKRVELDNEILIFCIKDSYATRWKAAYEAIKKVAPETTVHLTGNSNIGSFERLKAMGVPFDYSGVHYYKHGPTNICEVDSIVMGIGGYGSEIGKPALLTEFNWKRLTRLSPEERLDAASQLYSAMLKPRALPEFYQFQWQETLSANPRTARSGIRHYEGMYLDRRPKPEGLALMQLMKAYANEDAPVRELPVTIAPTTFKEGIAVATFNIENKTGQRCTLKLVPECFEAECRLLTRAQQVLDPGQQATGKLEIQLKPDALKGIYHFFLNVAYGDKMTTGWGMAAHVGAPAFSEKQVMPDLVDYSGWEEMKAVDWSLPTCVAFDYDCPVIELEMAYQVFNTLQSATGGRIRLCSTKDLPVDFADKWNMITVGAKACESDLAKSGRAVSSEKGQVVIARRESGATLILLYGVKPEQTEAAATDFTLRYWKNAKDSSIRLTGMDKGAALGNAAQPGVVDLP